MQIIKTEDHELMQCDDGFWIVLGTRISEASPMLAILAAETTNAFNRAEDSLTLGSGYAINAHTRCFFNRFRAGVRLNSERALMGVNRESV